MSITLSGLDAVVSKLDQAKKLDKALNSATKRTAQQVKTLLSAEIRKELALKKQYIDGKIFVNPKFASATDQSVEITTSMKSRGILFRNFRHSFTGKGRVRVLRLTEKPGQTKTIKRAFELKLKGYGGEDGGNGKTPVWFLQKPTQKKRRKPGGGYTYDTGYWGKENIAMYGPSPSQVFKTKKAEIAPVATDLFKKNLDQAIKYYLRDL